MQAWRKAKEPEAEAFSTCVTASPVEPRWRSITRPAAMPIEVVPTYAACTCFQARPASASAARTAVRPRWV